ncbi:DUF6318 family protein [Nesterenkonia sp. HG001]|uniref:DUF6318 family protein n=1 Tax=Nesterenkonia sp. HG001 TaxID=2983207 RepID=UPI002AC68DC6|nr:DUF6318 family protein [Nesterenkonia sp. HG001]MDZ5077598.1 DUF6318 family protein [Nesterenkonia sp. HG001]
MTRFGVAPRNTRELQNRNGKGRMVSDDARGLSQGWIRPITGLLLVAALALTSCGTGPEAAGTAEPDGGESASAHGGEDADDAEGAGDAQEDETPEPTPKPASSEGPGENLPVPEAPDELYEDSHEGAEAGMRHWFDLFVYARNTGDVGPVKDLSHEDCLSCHKMIETVEEVFEGNGWFVQESHKTHHVQFTDIDSGAVGGVFLLDTSDFEAYWDNEYHGTTEGTDDQVWTGHLDFTEDGWKVLSVRHEMPTQDSGEEG